MNDGIIKGTGDSRYLKSVSDFLTRYPSYTDFAAALIAGTLPVDLAGINADGWQQIGDALNKAHLFSDAVKAKYTDAEFPDDAFSLLADWKNNLYSYYVWRKDLLSTLTLPAFGDVQLGINFSNSKYGGSTIYYAPTAEQFVYGNYKAAHLNTSEFTSASDAVTFFNNNIVGYYFSVDYFPINHKFTGYLYHYRIENDNFFAHDSQNIFALCERASVSNLEEMYETVGYVESTDENTYPPNGESIYGYAGIGRLSKPKALTGCYVGNGNTSGSIVLNFGTNVSAFSLMARAGDGLTPTAAVSMEWFKLTENAKILIPTISGSYSTLSTYVQKYAGDSIDDFSEIALSINSTNSPCINTLGVKYHWMAWGEAEA